MSVVISEYFAEQTLVVETQAASGVAGPLHGAKIGMFTNPITLTEKTLLTELTQNIDANLVPASVTWGTAYRRQEGGIAIDASLTEFQLASSANAGSFYGYFIVDSGGTHLLLSESFANPLSLSDTLDGISIAAQFAMGGPDFGSAAVLA
jgi:hypothetical protein